MAISGIIDYNNTSCRASLTDHALVTKLHNVEILCKHNSQSSNVYWKPETARLPTPRKCINKAMRRCERSNSLLYGSIVLNVGCRRFTG